MKCTPIPNGNRSQEDRAMEMLIFGRSFWGCVHGTANTTEIAARENPKAA